MGRELQALGLSQVQEGAVNNLTRQSGAACWRDMRCVPSQLRLQLHTVLRGCIEGREGQALGLSQEAAVMVLSTV